MTPRVAVMRPTGSGGRCVAEVELHFDGEGPLKHIKLVGLTVCRGTQGDPYFVTLPSRAFGLGVERAYFSFLRPTRRGPNDLAEFKQWVLAEAQRQRPDLFA